MQAGGDEQPFQKAIKEHTRVPEAAIQPVRALTARCSGGQTKQNPSPSATASADSHKTTTAGPNRAG